MRYLSIFLFLWAGVWSLITLASASSPALNPFSLRSLSLQRIDSSHEEVAPSRRLDENNSFSIAWFFSRKWWEHARGASLESLLEPKSSPTTLAYRVVPRKYIPLRLRASRTSIPLNVPGERVFLPTPTRHHQPDIELFTSLDVLCKFLRFTLAVLLHLFTSPTGIWSAFEALVESWLGLAYDVERIMLSFCEGLIHLLSWALLLAFLCCRCILQAISLADGYLNAVLMHPVNTLDRIAFQGERFLKDRRFRQFQRDRLAYLTRTTIMRTSAVARPSGQHWSEPLFRREVHDDLNLLFLPEEASCPVRHMYDPRYFNCVKVIGSGAFGAIFQVEHRITGKMMALKKLMRRHNTGQEIDLEIRAMLRVRGSLWYPTLLSTFMDPDSFYLLMLLYTCDLYTFMTSCGGCLHRTQARFYLAELLLAIQCLHKKGIIHRDLKPENILFDQSGHLVVADFGVAYIFPEEHADAFMEDEHPLWAKMKRRGGDYFPLLTASVDNPHTVTGIAGTTFYSAPEVLEGQSYSYGVDYYSMAILYHEMVTGYVPIQCGPLKPDASEPEHCLDLTRKDVHLQPISMADLHFLVEMLDKDSFARPNVKQMKTHPIFAGINWEKLSRRGVPVPAALAVRKRVPISPSICRSGIRRSLRSSRGVTSTDELAVLNSGKD